MKPAKRSYPATSSRGHAPRLRIDDLQDHDHPFFERALALFDRTFPEKEKIDRQHFVAMLEEKKLGVVRPFNYHFLVAHRGPKVVGMSTGNYLAMTNMGFVGYLAVDPKWTGARVGSRLRSRLVAEFRRDARANDHEDLDAVIGEVEASNPWLASLVRRQNALPLDFAYRQPSLRKRSPSVELVLYLQPIGRPRRRIAAADLRALLFAIYRRVYRVKFPLRDPAFRKMMDDLEERGWVRRRKILTAARGSRKRSASAARRERT